MPTPQQADVELAKARLKAEFPKWSIIRTDRGRWFGCRGPLLSEDLDRQASVEADTPEGLAEKMRAVCRAR